MLDTESIATRPMLHNSIYKITLCRPKMGVYLTLVWQYTRVTSVIIGCCPLSQNQQMKAQKCQTIFVVKSISFQLLLRLMCSDSRLYFVSVLQNISVSLFVSLTKICPFPFQFQFQLTNITQVSLHHILIQDSFVVTSLHKHSTFLLLSVTVPYCEIVTFHCSSFNKFGV